MTDFDSGFFTTRIRDENLILADAHQVRIHGEVCPGMTLTDLIRSLLLNPDFAPRSLTLPKTVTKETPPCHGELTSQMIVKELNSFIRDDMVVVTDAGDCLFSCLDLQVNRFIAPAFYASVGFGVPAGIGVGLARSDTEASGSRGRWRLPDDRSRAMHCEEA